MIVVATVYEYRGIKMVSTNRRRLVTWEMALCKQDRVITNAWWLAAVLAPFSATHEFYCVDRRGPVDIAVLVAQRGRGAVAQSALLRALP